jgi:hypothetical protein
MDGWLRTAQATAQCMGGQACGRVVGYAGGCVAWMMSRWGESTDEQMGGRLRKQMGRSVGVLMRI